MLSILIMPDMYGTASWKNGDEEESKDNFMLSCQKTCFLTFSNNHFVPNKLNIFQGCFMGKLGEKFEDQLILRNVLYKYWSQPVLRLNALINSFGKKVWWFIKEVVIFGGARNMLIPVVVFLQRFKELMVQIYVNFALQA